MTGKGTAITKYPWKHLINENPTLAEFFKAWIEKYEFPFHKCKAMRLNIFNIPGDQALTVQTPKALICSGAFVYHVQFPFLEKEEDIYDSGCGCSWAIDLEDRRFYKINPDTGLPRHFEEVKACYVIKRFLKQNNFSIERLNDLSGLQHEF